MNRHDRRMKAAQTRRDREQGARLPRPHVPQGEDLRRRLNAAGKVIEDLTPGRPFVLLSAPVGMQVTDMGAVATITNMPREHAARLFMGMLDWWRPAGIVAQPDHRACAELREGVHLLRDISTAEISETMPATHQKLMAALAAGDADEICQWAIGVAVDALAIFDRHVPKVAKQPQGIPMPSQKVEPREWPKGNTKETLPADLELKPQSEVRDRLIAEARAGRFHDYDSDEVCGKVVANAELNAAGYPDLAQKVIDGGYDDERPTLEQEEEMRQQLGPEMFDAIMSGKPRTVQ